MFSGGRERERVHWKGMRMKEEMFYETQSQVFVKKVNFLKTKRCLKSIKRLPMLRRSPNLTMDIKIHPNPILWQIHWGKRILIVTCSQKLEQGVSNMFQLTLSCSKSTIVTLEKCAKIVQN